MPSHQMQWRIVWRKPLRELHSGIKGWFIHQVAWSCYPCWLKKNCITSVWFPVPIRQWQSTCTLPPVRTQRRRPCSDCDWLELRKCVCSTQCCVAKPEQDYKLPPSPQLTKKSFPPRTLHPTDHWVKKNPQYSANISVVYMLMYCRREKEGVMIYGTLHLQPVYTLRK